MIDYFIADINIQPIIREFCVLPFTDISDHRCLKTSIKTIFSIDKELNTEVKIHQIPERYIPNAASLRLFQKALSIDHNKRRLNEFNTAIFSEDQSGTDRAVYYMNSIITDVAKCTIHSKNVKLRKKEQNKNKTKDGIMMNVAI